MQTNEILRKALESARDHMRDNDAEMCRGEHADAIKAIDAALATSAAPGEDRPVWGEQRREWRRESWGAEPERSGESADAVTIPRATYQKLLKGYGAAIRDAAHSSAPSLQRYVWAGDPAAPMKHLTANEGPFYACADVDAVLSTPAPTVDSSAPSERCKACKGTGEERGAAGYPCPKCDGLGEPIAAPAPTGESLSVQEDERTLTEIAKAIYATYPGAAEHPWVEGGNSQKQEDARRAARKAAAPAPTGSSK